MLSPSGGWWGGGGGLRLTKLKTSYLPAEQVNHVKRLAVRHLRTLFFYLSIYLFLLSCPRRNWRKLCKLRNVKKLAVRNLRNVHNVHNTPWISLRLANLNYLCQLGVGGTPTCGWIVRHFSPSGVSVISRLASHR